MVKDLKFNDIVYDSRKVKKGDLFCAVRGEVFDGNNFVDKAIENGAVAILSDHPTIDVPDGIVLLKCENVKAQMAKIAIERYCVDLDNIFSMGVTGTNGKTSIATITHQILNNIFGQDFTCLMGTAGNIVCGDFFEAERTTPEAVDTIKMLGEAKNKVKALCMEASSHALCLDRLVDFYFNLCIFSNLTQDHLDFHGTMENYYQAKKQLFTKHVKQSGIIITNIDDEYGRRLFEELKTESRAKVYSVGFSEDADYKISDAHCDMSGTFFKIKHKLASQQKTLKLRSTLVGHFNVINCAEAVCGLLACGFNEEQVIAGLAGVRQVEGRIDKVEIKGAKFGVFVDYAHTPDAIVKVLSTARKFCKANLICVFGAGGDRDKTKRPLMAEAVAKNCDFAILTSDNPRSEDPQAIINDVKEGFVSDFTFEEIIDRREAIKFALKMAKDGDTIIIAGKGHEKYQEIAGVKHHFDDKEEAINLYKEIRNV